MPGADHVAAGSSRVMPVLIVTGALVAFDLSRADRTTRVSGEC